MRFAQFLMMMALLPTAALADVPAVSQDGTHGVGQLTEAAPAPEATAFAAVGADYFQAGSFIYSRDDVQQWRRYLSIGMALPQLEAAWQWRGLTTQERYVKPHSLSVNGDWMGSVKWSGNRGPFSGGLLAQGRFYQDLRGISPAVFALVQYRAGAWDFAGQWGWSHEPSSPGDCCMTPVTAFAWQKPSLNAVVIRMAVSYHAPALRPFLVFATERYQGDHGVSPQRVQLGAHVGAGFQGLALTPQVTGGLGSSHEGSFPAEPPWRAGLSVSYEIPATPILAALFPPPGRFVAAVTDGATRKEIGNAQIFFEGQGRDADANGRVRFEGAGRQYSLSIEAPGYLPASDKIVLLPGQLLVKGYALIRNAGTVRGMVLLDDRPGEAFVKIEGTGIATSTDFDTGAFSFVLPPDVYAITVTAPGFYPERRTFAITVGRAVVFDQLILHPRPVVRAPVVVAPQEVTAATSDAALPPAPKPAVETASAPVEPMAIVASPPTPKPDPNPEQEAERQAWFAEPSGPIPDRMISPVFFAFGSAQLLPHAYPSLDRLIAKIRHEPTIARIIVESRADTRGPQSVNQSLSSRRAEAVVKYLISKGIPEKVFATTLTYYQRQAVGQSDELRSEDRRVGFQFQRYSVTEVRP